MHVTPILPAATRYRSFTAAVAAIVPTLLGVVSATGERRGARYFIKYKMADGKTRAYEPTELGIKLNTEQALANCIERVKASLDLDQSRYLRPLSPDLHEPLGLSQEESAACRVFQVGPGRYAVAEEIPRAEWNGLQPNDRVLCAALTIHTDGTNNADLTTYEARFLVYDEKRDLFYADYTPDEEEASLYTLEGPQAHEVWLVWRFIETSAQ